MADFIGEKTDNFIGEKTDNCRTEEKFRFYK